jgi:hypothetical protein
MSLYSHWRLSVEGVQWALRFYARHFPVIISLSLLASTERAVSQYWDEPGAARIVLEALTWGVRIAIVVFTVRIAILADPRWRRDQVDPRVTAFLHDRWPSIAIDGALLGLAFVVFTAPEWLASSFTGDARTTYWAILLGVKNLTVIPLTFIWMIAIARQAVLYGGAERPNSTQPRATQPPH